MENRAQLRLGISTTFQPISSLVRLMQKGLIDFVELGIGSDKSSKELINALPHSAIKTLHGLPFRDESTSCFMFNPCYQPLSASEVLDEMMIRASQLDLDYEFYGVHAGLLGEIVGPDDFTVTKSIGVQKGFDNLAIFKRNIRESGKIILESIYGWNSSSRAIGMKQEELEVLGDLLPLLIDLGHVAINFELYGNLSLDRLRIENLPIAEVHVSFLDVSNPPPWDHRGFSPTGTNIRILSKLKEILDNFPHTPVVLEIVGHGKTIEDALEVVNKNIG